MLNEKDSPEVVKRITIVDSNNDVWYKSYQYEISEFFIINLVRSLINNLYL